jgi:hypothetical protein
MPNARELLEQADALMRRGRQESDDDIPVLTDVVDDTTLPAVPALEEPATLPHELPPLELLPVPTGGPTATIPAEAPVAPASQMREPASMPAPANDDPEVRELADQVYVQVLQRLDLYTEKALQEHLARHLQPVIERVSRELVSAVNANIGKLVRSFVAESVERELAQLRGKPGHDAES